MLDPFQILQSKAFELGFNYVAVAFGAPARRLDAYLNWIEAGLHGEMGYMARPDRVARRRDPQIILPGLRSIITVGLSYSTSAPPHREVTDPSRGRISNYAWSADYHDVMEPRLEELAAWIAEIDPAARSRVYVDTGAILERDHAEAAGLGFTGKNTMLIAPRSGSWFFLGEVLTTLPMAPTTPPPMPTCGTCHRCLEACPTGAFPSAYQLDARRCISYLTIELKGWIPIALRPLMGNWIYGCDICQEVCPFNRFAEPMPETGVSAMNIDEMAPPLLDILALDEEAFNHRFRGTPIKRIKRTRLLRNACVAAGNWGDSAAVPYLVELLADEEPILRGHAAWALRQIDDVPARAALRDALESEQDGRVCAEIRGQA
jgi:epoxyqueuosine reductase